MMKIFVLLSRIPWPLEKGDKLRAFHQIKSLSRSNEIILCALNTDPEADKEKARMALAPFCSAIIFIDLNGTSILSNLVLSGLNGKPFQTGYFYSKKAQKLINQSIAQHRPDFIYAQLLRVAEYVRHQKLPKALDYQDVFSMGMKRRVKLSSFFVKPFLSMEYVRLIRYEKLVFDDFDLKTIISIPDRNLIPHPQREQILVVPNGVDHEYFKPMAAIKKYALVFTGNMAYPPNVNAARFLSEKIMPLVWLKFPKARLLIAGATPDKSVCLLANDLIHVSGWMDDIRMAYAESKVFVAPMQIGTGLQNKLLEAMSMQLPCVTTPLANDSLKAQHQTQILVGETAEELAENIIALLSDAAFAQKIAHNGYQFVNQNYDWDAACDLLQNEMQRILQENKLSNTNL